MIGGDGTVYVGSADCVLYAIKPEGSISWSFRTGGVIDSAALVSDGRVTIGSGDGHLYRLRTDPELSADERVEWCFSARPSITPGQVVSWWEGNVVSGLDGLLLAGNTAGHAYALNPDGTENWVYETGNALWSAPAVGEDGTSYWGSLDLCVHAIDRFGVRRWSTTTLGFVVSSPALGNDGVLYVGSFDGNLYALDANTGEQRWSFATGDSIYSSPALLETDGVTSSIFVASTDGSVYALRADGTMLWRYDVGAVVRSSPVVSPAPSDTDGSIVYVGAADGVLYALDATSGERRWSFDTTEQDASDRSSLNGSPALGATGIYIGSEDGSLWYVPYDYPLHHEDPRGSMDPGEPYPDDLEMLFPVTPGGATVTGLTPPIGPSAAVPLRLMVRRGGVTLDAELDPDVDVVCTPWRRFTARCSGDGHYLFVVPTGFWPQGEDLQLHVRGRWRASRGVPGGVEVSGGIDQTVTVLVAPESWTLPIAPGAGRPRLHLRRLSVPLPPFAASVNQIGFDSYDWLLDVMEVSGETTRTGTVEIMVRGARADQDGAMTVDPQSPFEFSMVGRYEGNAVSLTARRVDLPFSFGIVPVDRFELRFQLDDDLSVRPGASMYGEVICADIPHYGPLLRDFTRLPDTEGRMAVSGTFQLSRA